MSLRILKQAFWPRRGMPLHLILHVTYRCPSRCQTCFNWRNLNTGKKDLSLEELEAISRSLGDLLWLHLSGGEPFLREDLPDLCEMFCRNNHPAFLSIPTSGMDPERIERIGKEILRRVRIPVAIDLPLDGLGSQHDEIRGVKGSFEKLLDSHKGLVKLQQSFPHLSTKITTVISNKNIGNLEEITDFVYTKLKGISFHTLIFLRGNPRSSDVFLPPLEELITKKDLLLKTWQRYGYDRNISFAGRIVGNAAHRLLLDDYYRMMRENRNCIRCLAGLSHVVIGADGEVFFCELLDGIGNLRDYSYDFQRLWKTEKAEKLRTFIKADGCWCTHGCVHMDNLFLNARMYPRLAGYVAFDLLQRVRAVGRDPRLNSE